MGQVVVVGSLGLFVALAAAFVYVLRRAAGVVAVAREDDVFRRDGAVLAERTAATIASGAQRIDRVRRRQDPPASLDDVLPALRASLDALCTEVDALSPPAPLAPLRARLAEEIVRALRAVETVEHGCTLLGVTTGRPREQEGETSVKRGYLNLLHAREAMVTLAVDLRSGRVDSSRWFSDRPRA